MEIALTLMQTNTVELFTLPLYFEIKNYSQVANDKSLNKH